MGRMGLGRVGRRNRAKRAPSAKRSISRIIERLEQRTMLSINVARTGAAPNFTVTFTDDAVALVNNRLELRFNAANELEYSVNGGSFTNNLGGGDMATFGNIATIVTNLGPGSDNLVLNLQTFAFDARVLPVNANPLQTAAILTDTGGGHAVQVDLTGTELLNLVGVGRNDNLRVETSNGNSNVRVENAGPPSTDELLASDMEPRVQFSAINAFTFANRAGSQGANVV